MAARLVSNCSWYHINVQATSFDTAALDCNSTAGAVLYHLILPYNWPNNPIVATNVSR